MKCPKCNYVSFEYLNNCKKCGNDLTVHKTELGIDFPRAESLGIMAVLRQETAGVAAEEAVAVAEEVGAESGTDALSGTSGLEAAITADTDFHDLGAGIDLDAHEGLDLTGIGESSDETASISLPGLDEEEISLGEETAAPPAEKEDEITLDLSAMEEGAPAAVEETVPDELDLGELDLGETAEAEPMAALPAKEEISDIEAGDLETKEESTGAQLEGALGLGEEEETVVPAAGSEVHLDDISFDLGAEEPAPASAEPSKEGEFDLDLGEETTETAVEEPEAPVEESPTAHLDGLDLNLDLSDIDLETPSAEPEKKEEKEKKKEEKGDFDLDLNLDDLKLE